MVFYFIKTSTFPLLTIRYSEYRIQQIIHHCIQFLHGKASIPDRCCDLSCRVQPRCRHFQIGACFHTVHMVIGTTPICDNYAVKPPFFSEDIPEQMLIFIGINAVHLVIAGHHCFRPAFFYGDLKTGQIDFPESPLIQNRIHCHSAKLLAVYRKMLGAGADTLTLYSLNVRRCHLPRQVGVFRKIFKIPAAKRTSFDI